MNICHSEVIGKKAILVVPHKRCTTSTNIQDYTNFIWKNTVDDNVITTVLSVIDEFRDKERHKYATNEYATKNN